MAITYDFDTYRDQFETIKLERDENGILLVTLHTDGGELVWGLEARQELTDLWEAIGHDRGNRIVILTGSGDQFIGHESVPVNWTSNFGATHERFSIARRLVYGQLEIEVPMIAAVNGNVLFHAEQPLMCDLILSTPGALWADDSHIPVGVVPGDGVHVVWPAAIGLNRARHLFLTGGRYTAEQMLEFGGISEVVPKEDLLPRAYELAHQMLKLPDLALRSTRHVLTMGLRRSVFDNMSTGLLREHLAYLDPEGPFKS